VWILPASELWVPLWVFAVKEGFLVCHIVAAMMGRCVAFYAIVCFVASVVVTSCRRVKTIKHRLS
jgi:hypothetical protein